ncbi:hypothetical protein VCRLGP8_530231 [Vibrio crassostreae]|nr:hypothetical protein VCRLGP8_530231 [Vibrio crassostreae]
MLLLHLYFKSHCMNDELITHPFLVVTIKVKREEKKEIRMSYSVLHLLYRDPSLFYLSLYPPDPSTRKC